MPTREQLVDLLDHGHTYETAARALGIPAGQAYMIVTGIPADSSDTPPPEEAATRRLLPSSTQQLVNPPAFNPTRSQEVDDWVRRRAARDLTRSAS